MTLKTITTRVAKTAVTTHVARNAQAWEMSNAKMEAKAVTVIVSES